MKGFNEDSIKQFMLWQQEHGSKQPFGAKKTVDPAPDPPPSAPRGRGKFNLPKKKKNKTMPKDEDINDDKVRGVPRRSISPETMKRHTDTHSHTHARTQRTRTQDERRAACARLLHLLADGRMEPIPRLHGRWGRQGQIGCRLEVGHRNRETIRHEAQNRAGLDMPGRKISLDKSFHSGDKVCLQVSEVCGLRGEKGEDLTDKYCFDTVTQIQLRYGNLRRERLRPDRR